MMMSSYFHSYCEHSSIYIYSYKSLAYSWHIPELLLQGGHFLLVVRCDLSPLSLTFYTHTCVDKLPQVGEWGIITSDMIIFSLLL